MKSRDTLWLVKWLIVAVLVLLVLLILVAPQTAFALPAT